VAALAFSPAPASAASCTPPYCPSHTLTVKKAGTGSGAVTSSPAGIECGAKCAASFEEGTAVALTAKAASGSVFTGWSGGCHGTKACTLAIAADTTVTATFRAKSQSGRGGPSTAAIAQVTRRLVPVRHGRAKLRLQCVGNGDCHGTLNLTTKVRRGPGKKGKRLVIARAPFDLAAGASATVRVKLTRRGRQMLKRRRKLKARATGPGLASSQVKLKPAKKHRHR
jgi:hypothetical protein